MPRTSARDAWPGVVEPDVSGVTSVRVPHAIPAIRPTGVKMERLARSPPDRADARSLPSLRSRGSAGSAPLRIRSFNSYANQCGQQNRAPHATILIHSGRRITDAGGLTTRAGVVTVIGRVVLNSVGNGPPRPTRR